MSEQVASRRGSERRIPSHPAAGPRPLPAPPTRRQIETDTVEVLRGGAWWKPDVLVVATAGGRVVVKDYAAKGPVIRLLGRLQIRHETHAYRWLGPMPGLPAFLGRVDSHALALEKIDGGPLAAAQPDHPDEELERLAEIFAGFTAHCFLHLDLRSRHNVLRRCDGSPVVVDLAASLWIPQVRGLSALMRRGLKRLYGAVLLKWKALLARDHLTPAEKARLRRFARFERLWPFNGDRPRKRRRRARS